MATNPFDRVVINPQERPLSLDHNQQASNVSRAQMWMLQALLASYSASGTNPSGAVFFGAGYKVISTGGLGVSITAGLGAYNAPTDTPSAIGGISGVDDISPTKPLPLYTPVVFSVPASDPALTRVDLIEVKINRRLEQPSTRDILNVTTGQIIPTSVNKVLAFYDDQSQCGSVISPANSTAGISYKQGTPGGGAPAVTNGYAALCTITLAPAAGSITQVNITDLRVDSGLTALVQSLIPPGASPAAGSMVRAGIGVDPTYAPSLTNVYATLTWARNGAMVGGVVGVPGSGTLKAPSTGTYLLQWSLSAQGPLNGNLFARLYNQTQSAPVAGGTDYAYGFVKDTSPFDDYLGGSGCTAVLNANDQIIVQVLLGSVTGTVTFYSGYFSMLKVG